jgi:hypothetical protein
MVTLLGALVVWSGYTLFAYGYSQIRGCNIGLRDLAWPGRTIACNPDSGGTGASAAAAAKTAANAANPNYTGTLPAGTKITSGKTPNPNAVIGPVED